MIVLKDELSANLLWQYTAVGIILLGICIWMILKLTKKDKNNSNPCCNCGLSGSCKKEFRKKELKNRKSNGNCKDLQ